MTPNVYTLLKKKFPGNEYALLEEVRDKAGFHASRAADYVVINLWPSRGLAVTGIELKSFRSDWLSELKKPQKAENIFQYCDYFYLLTTDESVAKLEEIPETWGWMCVKGNKIQVIKEAPKLAPVAISRHFFAAAIKRADNKNAFTRTSEIEEKLAKYKEIGRNESKNQIEHLKKELAEIRKAVADFKESSGIDLTGYYRWSTNPKKMGAAVRLIEDGGAEKLKDELLRLEETAKNICSRITAGIEVLSKTDA